jgi:type 1 fimbria pilin
MRDNPWLPASFRQNPYEWRYQIVKVAFGLALLLALGLSWGLVSSAQAAGVEVDGNVGVLHVQGALTESACRLDMTSAWQEVSLGEIGTGRLQSLGARGNPVQVQLKLRDCVASLSRNPDARSGNQYWSQGQPSVAVGFTAPADAGNPELIKVNGASGIGLRLTDSANRAVILGARNTPIFVTPRQDQLTYNIALERTAAPLVAGRFWSQISFRLNYD